MAGIKIYALSHATSNKKNDELTKTEVAPALRKHIVINCGPANLSTKMIVACVQVASPASNEGSLDERTKSHRPRAKKWT